MPLVDSLLTALVRLDGDALVMHVGEKPYVVTTSESAGLYRGPLSWGQIELSTRTLTVEAVAGMVAQLLPAEQRAHLSDVGAVEYQMPPNPAVNGQFAVIAARGGDDIWLEIRHRRPEPAAPAVQPAPAQPVPAAAPATSAEEPSAEPPALAAEPAPVAEPQPPSIPVQPAAEAEPEPVPEVAATPSEVVTEAPAVEPVTVAEPAPVAEAPAPEPVAAAAPAPVAEAPAVEPVAAAAPAPVAEAPTPEPVAAAVPAPATVPEPVAEAPAVEPVAAPEPVPVAEVRTPEPVAAAPPALVADVPAVEPVAAEQPEPVAQAPATEPVAATAEPVAEAPAVEPVGAVDSGPAIHFIEAEARVEPERPRARDEDEFEIELDVEGAAPPPVPAGAPPPAAVRAEREERHEEEYYDLSADALHDEEIEIDLRPAEPPARPRAEAPRAPAPPSRTEPIRPAIVVPMTRLPIWGDAPAEGRTVQRSALDRLLRVAAARGASALYIVTNTSPAIRVDGEIQILDSEEALTAIDVATMLMELAPEPSREALLSGSITEWICDMAEIGRVRCMSFHDHRGQGCIFRLLPARALSVQQLGLSREVEGLCREAEGLVLVTGPRSSGKSTLVSAFVDLINRTRADHVITLEGQIKFVHESRRSLVSQRELRGDAEELKAAVRAALREDPDVLVIEDLRSADVIAAALDAAESGRLVFGALPAASTTAAIERMIDQFPQDRRAKVQTSLAAALRGVVAQVLLRKIGGGRVAAREILLNTPPVAALLAEGKTFQLGPAIDHGRKHGMAPLNDALVAFVRSGAVAPAEAYRKAADRDGLLVQLRREGVDTSFVERLA